MSNLIVTDRPREIFYTASAGQTVFDIPFAYDDASHIFVKVTEFISGEVATFNVDTGDLLVSPEAGEEGVATLNIPLAVNDSVIIYSDTVLERSGQFSQSIKKEALNAELNRLVLMAQDINSRQNRAISVPYAEEAITFPSKSERAGKLMGMDNDGNFVAQDVYDVKDLNLHASWLPYLVGDPTSLFNDLKNVQFVQNYLELFTYPIHKLQDGCIVSVAGRLTALDGGFGLWQWYAFDPTPVDDGSILAHESVAGRWKRLFSEHINVRWYDVLADGLHNDAPGIQKAVKLSENTAFPVYMPPSPNPYLWDSPVLIAKADCVVEIFGAGWDTSAQFGTIIKITNPDIIPITAVNGASFFKIRKVAFRQSQPAPVPDWSPTVYKQIIQITAGTCLIEDVFFYNVYRCIKLGSVGGTPIGRCHVNRCWAAPYFRFVEQDNILDVNRFSNCHIWPFGQAADPNIINWTTQNGRAFMLGRSDNCNISGCFVGAMNAALYLVRTADGAVNKLSISDCDFDFCAHGMIVSGHGHTVLGNNTRIQCSHEHAETRGILINGNLNRINFSGDIGHTSRESINVTGSDNVVSLPALRMKYWDREGSGLYTGITSTDSTNSIKIGIIDIDESIEGAAPVIGGQLAAFEWENIKKGPINATPNSSGDIAVFHNLGFVPNRAEIQIKSNTSVIAINQRLTATHLTVRFIDVATGAAYTSSNIEFNYSLHM